MNKATFALSAPADAAPATNPLGLERIDHFQMTGTIDRLEPLYRRLGFSRVASGRAPWGRILHLRQQRMDVLILEADETHPAGRYFRTHGEGVCALNFQVADLDLAINEAMNRGGELMVAPETHAQGEGTLRFAAIKGVGDVLNYLVERRGELPAFWHDLKPDPGPALCEPGLVRVDHLTNNVGAGEMAALVAFYERVFGFRVTRTFQIRGALGTGLNSMVVQSPDNRVIIPINEPADDRSQIQEFVQRHHGPGVQHIAMSTNDIQETLRILTGLQLPAGARHLLRTAAGPHPAGRLPGAGRPGRAPDRWGAGGRGPYRLPAADLQRGPDRAPVFRDHPAAREHGLRGGQFPGAVRFHRAGPAAAGGSIAPPAP